VNTLLKKYTSSILIIAVVGVIFVFGASQREEDSTSKGASLVDSLSIDRLIEGKTEGEALRAIAEAEGIEVAWQYLKEKYASNPLQAHDLAHVIGYLAYGQEKERGFSVCDQSFSFGCYHGLLSLLLADEGLKGITKAQRGCSAIPTLGGVNSCMHGIGHGILVWGGYDISKALADCDILTQEESVYCYDGVFMENITGLMSPNDQHWRKLAIELNDDLHWPCSVVDEKYKQACYYQQTSAFLILFNNDIAKVEEACMRAEREELVEYCIRGIGVRVGQFANGVAEQAISLCRILEYTKNEQLCLSHSAQEFTFQGQSQQKVDVICSSLPPDLRTLCEQETDRTRQDYEEVSSQKNSFGSVKNYEEIQKILATGNLIEQVASYRKLIERVGAVQAQEALLRSGLPFTGDTHLLNHEAGYFLYENEGPAGIIKCKDYFLSSCYHGLLIEAMAGRGSAAISVAMEACKKAGSTVVAQCAHAIGHGLLAWSGYKNLPDALALCDKVESEVENFPVYHCHDGVFMENNYAVHLGAPSPDRWIKYDDPFYPCNDSRIEEKYRKACWSNQPQMMLEIFRGDFVSLGALCDKVENNIYRKTCFNSIARHIHSFTLGDADVAFRLCALMPQDQYADCVADVALSDFGIGGRKMAFAICTKMDEEGKKICYLKLFGAISAYKEAVEPRQECGKIQEERWREECLERFGR